MLLFATTHFAIPPCARGLIFTHMSAENSSSKRSEIGGGPELLGNKRIVDMFAQAVVILI